MAEREKSIKTWIILFGMVVFAILSVQFTLVLTVMGDLNDYKMETQKTFVQKSDLGELKADVKEIKRDIQQIKVDLAKKSPK